MKKIILSSLAVMFATVASMAQYRSISAYHYYNAGANSYIGNDATYANTSAGGVISWNVTKTAPNGYNSTSIEVNTVAATPAASSVDISQAASAANKKRIILSVSANPAVTNFNVQVKDKNGMVGNYGSTPANQAVGTTATVLTFQYTGAMLDGYSGTCLPTAVGACSVDSTAIQTILINPEPGAAYTGTITINYVYLGDSTAHTTMGLVSGTTLITSGSSFDLGTTTAGTASSAKTITIGNVGNVPLFLTGSPIVAISGANASDFVVTQTAVSSPVAATNGTTSFTVALSASAAAGAKTATLTIASNDATTPSYTVALTGTVNALATAVSEALSNATVISPNPFSDNINVKLSSAISGNVSATVRNAYGVAVASVSNVNASDFNVSTANLTPGMYILEIMTNDGTTAIKRIVKQ